MEKYIYRKRETDSIEVIYVLGKNTVLDELRKVFGFQLSTYYFCKQNKLDNLESLFNHFIKFGDFLSLEEGNTIESSLELIEFCELIKYYSNITMDEPIFMVEENVVEDIDSAAQEDLFKEFSEVLIGVNETYNVSLIEEFPNLYSTYASKSVSLFSIINYVLQRWSGISGDERSYLNFIIENKSFSSRKYSDISNIPVPKARVIRSKLLDNLSLKTSSPLRYLPSVFQDRCSIDFFNIGSVLWILDQSLNSKLQEMESTDFPIGFTCLILSSYRPDIRWLKLEELSIQKRIQNYTNVELFVDMDFEKVGLLFAKTIFHNFEQLFDAEREYYERKNISLIIKEFAAHDYVEGYNKLVHDVRLVYTNENIDIEERIQLVSNQRNEFNESFRYYFTIVNRILEYFYNSNDNSSVSILLEGDNELGVREQRAVDRRVNIDNIQLFTNDWNVTVVKHPHFTNSLVIYGDDTYIIRKKLKLVAKYYQNINIGEIIVPGWIISELKYTVLLSYYGISNFLMLEEISETKSRELLVELFNSSPNALLINGIDELIDRIIEERPDNINDLEIVIIDFDDSIDIGLFREVEALILMVLDSCT